MRKVDFSRNMETLIKNKMEKLETKIVLSDIKNILMYIKIDRTYKKKNSLNLKVGL